MPDQHISVQLHIDPRTLRMSHSHSPLAHLVAAILVVRRFGAVMVSPAPTQGQIWRSFSFPLASECFVDDLFQCCQLFTLAGTLWRRSSLNTFGSVEKAMKSITSS
jgi:hypothetical protein